MLECGQFKLAKVHDCGFFAINMESVGVYSALYGGCAAFQNEIHVESKIFENYEPALNRNFCPCNGFDSQCGW